MPTRYQRTPVATRDVLLVAVVGVAFVVLALIFGVSTVIAFSPLTLVAALATAAIAVLLFKLVSEDLVDAVAFKVAQRRKRF